MTIERSELDEQMAQRSRSFDAWAIDYDRYRPTYPQELFDFVATRLELPDRPDVADLGAGTGKAARQMARRGWHVIAVEPGEGMLDVLRARAAAENLDIVARLGAAESTGLDDESVDLVTAAQAFHWFEKPPAVEEMARIVRPGGGAAVFWNSRADERSDFLADYTRIMEPYIPDDHVDKRDQTGEPSAIRDLKYHDLFAVDDRVVLQHDVTMTAEAFISYVFTASYVRLFVSGEDQASFRGDLAALLDKRFPDGQVVVPYDVDLYVARRTAKGANR